MWEAGWLSKTSAESFPLCPLWSLIFSSGPDLSTWQGSQASAQNCTASLLPPSRGYSGSRGWTRFKRWGLYLEEEPQRLQRGLDVERENMVTLFATVSSHLPDEIIYFNRNTASLNHLAFRWRSQDLDQNSQTPELKLFVTVLSYLWIFQH